MFGQREPALTKMAPILDQRIDHPRPTLQEANKEYGLDLDSSEIKHLVQVSERVGLLHRYPYLEELFVFAQINSGRCQHKHFNAL